MPLQSVSIIADTPRSIPGGMRRHMELHATGLRRHGIGARCFFSEDAVRTRIAGIDSRLPGARMLAPMLRDLRRHPPSLLNVHTLCAPAFIAARQLGLIRAPIVIMSYAADERALPSSPGPRQVLHQLRIALPQKHLLPLADGIWCVNREDARFYSSRYVIPDEKLRIIPHALDDFFYAPQPLAREPETILFAGTWIHRKGADVVTRALPLILQGRPGARVILAGILDKSAQVERDIAPIRDRVTIIPQLDDDGMRALYARATLMLVPSRLEGLPFTLLESMAQGCPSLCAANSGMLDVIRDGDNGWLIKSHEPQSWASRVVGLLENPSAIARASAGAREDSRRFHLDELTPRAIDWYRALTS